ncbi:SDR family NAD(P)-dependent oxidoreductase [Deinococcus cellulosilyticus]|uniref:3-oxoacyl-ACP reductase n=1 Tax=Deinococcus cellulosilyticus (strain DSM 18568 / NBRC 106333 / KACC 11606 / 5516J-15) TaxID=1223518 RepID=A0A511NB15_DEIC1|nr:glucose 1-dehydrogenase [Deinococcus cellulosilyticus]GEM49571.1 3-oxoacyl-ACP reductase [Deinococcus cellulosilyticus NBRC 106333 = KACC 11606]
MNAFDLTGKVCIVTGGAQGIGYAISQELIQHGATVYIVDQNQEVGQEAAGRLGARFKGLNVTDSTQVSAVFQQITVEAGQVDVLVNNAGIVRNTPAEETTDSEWDLIMKVNLDGVFSCCRAIAPHMLERGSGSIINLASMSGIISNHPQPQAAYNTSKAGVIMLTRSLAGEWASRGVRVNAIAPGYVATPLTKKGMETEEWRKVWLETIPMGRLAEPEEIGPSVVYLASRASSYVTGSVLTVDGGYTIW